MTIVVVVCGGPDRPSGVVLPEGAVVVAADGGVALASALGWPVDVAVGDFDSVSREALAAAGRLERHPASKDASDLELALRVAVRLGAERIVVVGGGGGRLDHLLGVVLVLAADAFARVRVDGQIGGAAVHVVRDERRFEGTPGELLSLFAVHGPAFGVLTEGLVYPLRGETLEPGASLGLSNVFAESRARVAVERGAVLVVRPSGSVWAGS
jgi:thiamine pyrophosphokinase